MAGRKKWLLLPPEHTPLLFDKFGREMAPSFDLVDETPELAEKFPNLQLARKLAVEVDQVKLATGHTNSLPLRMVILLILNECPF